MRSLRAGIGIVAAALLLTACSGVGSNGGSDAIDTSTKPADVKGNVSYAIWDVNQQPAMEALIKDFNKTYPNVNVKLQLTAYGQYFTKLQTQGSSKTLPDVFWMNGPNFQLYASNGLLAKLAPFEKAGLVDTADYPKAMNDIYTLDGEQYGIPKDFDTIAVFYNKDILERAGVAAPTSKWTWDDYRAIAKQITEKLGSEGIIGSGDNYDTQSMVYPSIFSNGGTVIDAKGKSGYDDPKTVQALEFWRSLVADGSMLSPAQNADTSGLQKFLDGKAGMVWCGNWQVSALLGSTVANSVRTVELPLAPSGERKTVIHGIGNVLAATSATKPAAQAFFSYLGGKQAAEIQAKMGTANPAFTGTQQAFVDSAPQYDLQIFENAATQYSVAYPVSKNTGAWNTIEAKLLPQAFSGEKPVPDVAAELAQQMNAALAKE
jgi:multiple sugar transport system substrate-binding protein